MIEAKDVLNQGVNPNIGEINPKKKRITRR